MRKVITLLTALLMLIGMMGVASAADHGQPWPAHGHLLLLHIHYDAGGEPESYGKCVDIANGRQLDRAHHTTLHTGRASQALERANHMVIPTSGLTPFANCEQFAQFLPPRG